MNIHNILGPHTSLLDKDFSPIELVLNMQPNDPLFDKISDKFSNAVDSYFGSLKLDDYWTTHTLLKKKRNVQDILLKINEKLVMNHSLSLLYDNTKILNELYVIQSVLDEKKKWEECVEGEWKEAIYAIDKVLASADSLQVIRNIKEEAAHVKVQLLRKIIARIEHLTFKESDATALEYALDCAILLESVDECVEIIEQRIDTQVFLASEEKGANQTWKLMIDNMRLLSQKIDCKLDQTLDKSIAKQLTLMMEPIQEDILFTFKERKKPLDVEETKQFGESVGGVIRETINAWIEKNSVSAETAAEEKVLQSLSEFTHHNGEYFLHCDDIVGIFKSFPGQHEIISAKLDAKYRKFVAETDQLSDKVRAFNTVMCILKARPNETIVLTVEFCKRNVEERIKSMLKDAVFYSFQSSFTDESTECDMHVVEFVVQLQYYYYGLLTSQEYMPLAGLMFDAIKTNLASIRSINKNGVEKLEKTISTFHHNLLDNSGDFVKLYRFIYDLRSDSVSPLDYKEYV